MKRHKIILFSSLALAGALFSACETVDFDASDNGGSSSQTSGVTRSVKLVAKAADQSLLSYPVGIYAFDEEGRMVSSATVTSSDDQSAQLSLKKGRYHLTAVSLPASYPQLSSVSGTDAVISMPEEGYSMKPLMTGSADISVASADQTANISLGYRQAAVSLTISNVPANYTGVSVSLSSSYTDMTLAGDLSGKKMVTVPCTKGATEGNTATWSSGTFYVLPTINAQPSITIALNGGANGEVSYSHTYNASLNAGTPYKFTAVYTGKASEGGEVTPSDEDIKINANISAGTWGTEVNESFNFGPEEGGTTGGGSSEDDSPVIKVTEFPLPGDVWNGHVVAFADDYGEECEMLLISIKEWSSVPSALSDTPDKAQQVADGYEENGLSGWSIPTKEEGKDLAQCYNANTTFDGLNSTINSVGGVPLSKTSGSSNVRYLCNGGSSTFSFNSSTISNAGAKTLYNLRLVKAIKLVK